jgi:hypothetical protein
MKLLTGLCQTRRRVGRTLHVARQALSPKNTLLAGPYSGELGWELMEWAGYVRRLSKQYQRTIVVSYQGHRCLYDQCEFYRHELSLQDSGYWYGSLAPPKIDTMVAHYRDTLGLTSFDWLHPTHLNRYTKRLLGPQIFWDPFDRRLADYKYDVGFHFRSIRRADLDTKNYPVSYARELINRCKAVGICVCCIGHPQYSFCPDNCDDLRSADLSETRSTLRGIKILAGGSSAPMHLASSCGLPIVVWWKAAPFDSELRDRYLDLWNPHKASVFIASDSTFQPAPEHVLSQIIKALDALPRSREILPHAACRSAHCL